MIRSSPFFFFFFFNDTATTEIYTLSLHDALPISHAAVPVSARGSRSARGAAPASRASHGDRSEEHTSELQSRSDLVCRLLLEKKKKKNKHVKDLQHTTARINPAIHPNNPDIKDIN